MPRGAISGAKVLKPPQNYDYGMRDFDVIDLDGNHLTFGMESVSSSCCQLWVVRVGLTEPRRLPVLAGVAPDPASMGDHGDR